MTERITAAELAEIERAIAGSVKHDGHAWWEPPEQAAPGAVVLSPPVAKRLVAELRRLRALILDIAGADPAIGPVCPRRGDRCWWCAVGLEEDAPASHEDGCPWPGLEREVLAAVEDR